MAIPKYALLENERRFLVAVCPDLSRAPVRMIEDLYIADSRLRLRTITHFDGQAPEFKLCKKYGSQDPASGPIVNIYLSANEHMAFSGLPGLRLRKHRYRIEHGGHAFSVDVFGGALAGLILCEAEAESADVIRALPFPPWISREVTDDLFFTGGNLATAGAAELKRHLGA